MDNIRETGPLENTFLYSHRVRTTTEIADSRDSLVERRTDYKSKLLTKTTGTPTQSEQHVHPRVTPVDPTKPDIPLLAP